MERYTYLGRTLEVELMRLANELVRQKEMKDDA